MRTQHVKLQLPTPSIILLLAVTALKLQYFSIVEVQSKRFQFRVYTLGIMSKVCTFALQSVMGPILF